MRIQSKRHRSMDACGSPRFSRLAAVLLVFLAAALLYGIFRVALHQTVSRHLQASARSIPGCTGLRYDRLALSHFSLQCQIHKATLLFDNPADAIPFERIHIRRFRPGKPLPRQFDMLMEGFRIRPSHPMAAPLQAYLRGVANHPVRGHLQMEWDRQGEKTEAWSVGLTAQIADLGEVQLSFRLGKVNPDGVALALNNPLNWLMVLPGVELVEGRCRYEDEGLFNRILTYQAREQGHPPEQIRAAMLGRLQRRLEAEKAPGVRAVWRSLMRFCQNPGRIRLTTLPSEPIPLGQLLWMRQPRDFIQRLAVESIVE